MLDGLYCISKRTGKPYYGAAALVGNIFAQQQEDEDTREAELEEHKRPIRELGYASSDD